MKHLAFIKTLIITLFITSLSYSYAQQPASVQATIDKIVKKHESSKGVSCMTVGKGSGLGMMKMMFNQEFGKDFMKGVTSITIIEYSEASADVCAALRKDLDAFVKLLEEFDVSEDKIFSDNDYIRCFASIADSNTISDFVMALESEDSKMIMYMSGEIKID